MPVEVDVKQSSLAQVRTQAVEAEETIVATHQTIIEIPVVEAQTMPHRRNVNADQDITWSGPVLALVISSQELPILALTVEAVNVHTAISSRMANVDQSRGPVVAVVWYSRCKCFI